MKPPLLISIKILVLSVVLAGCQAMPVKKNIVVYRDTSLFDAICESPESPAGFETNLDVKITAHYQLHFETLSLAGKKSSTSKSTCLLERSDIMEQVPESTRIGRFYAAECKVGTKMFSQSSLQMLDQETHFVLFRRTDGKVWIFPRKLCSFEQEPR